MIDTPLQDCPPDEPYPTDYDEAHFSDYLRLLDAAIEGADWRDVARATLGLDPSCDLARARHIYESHLARARWMSEIGYACLLGPSGHSC